MRLALIPGHTPKAFGSYGMAPIEMGEHQFCVNLCGVAYRFARECGIECKIFTRTDNQTIYQIYDEVNAWATGNSVAVEVHFNASVEHKAQGTETLFFDESCIEFSRKIHDGICDVLGRKGKQNRGLKKLVPGDRGAANLKAMKVTGCLIEPFFGDQQADANLGFMKSWDIAQAIAKASFNYLIEKEATDPNLDKQ